NCFLGTVDEVSVYNRALSVSEINAIWESGTAGKCVMTFPPVIASQPPNQSVRLGEDFSIGVFVQGTAPLSYQWRFNGTNLAGKTNQSLTIPNVQFTDAGLYSVLVTNDAGAVTSTNAVLTVSYPPATIWLNDTVAQAGDIADLPISLAA